jgi:hypothetical protein
MRLTNHATVIRFSRRREAGSLQEDIPIKPEVDDFCWSHFGRGGEMLIERYENSKDQAVEDTEVYTIYQLGNTSYQYRIRETGGIPGIIIDWIGHEEIDY